MIWGDRDIVGDPNDVQAALRGVDEVYSIKGAFAAVLKEGSVVTWGSWHESNKVQVTLRGVDRIYSQTTNLVKSRRLGLCDLG